MTAGDFYCEGGERREAEWKPGLSAVSVNAPRPQQGQVHCQHGCYCGCHRAGLLSNDKSVFMEHGGCFARVRHRAGSACFPRNTQWGKPVCAALWNQQSCFVLFFSFFLHVSKHKCNGAVESQHRCMGPKKVDGEIGSLFSLTRHQAF